MHTAIETGFDFVIVGAGSGGAVLAARLTEDASASVALVEAGGWPTNPLIGEPGKWPLLQGSEIDWAYRTQPQANTDNRVHDWPRGRVLGGSSAINAMAHVRGHPSDFDRWRDAGCAGWGYSDLMPYFIKSETYEPGASAYHGDRGPVHLIRPSQPNPLTKAYMESGAEMGIAPTDDHNAAQMTGPCLNTLTIKNGHRQTVFDAYLAPAASRKNLRIMANSTALSLVVEKNRCAGLRVAGEDGASTLAARQGIILCAGAIGSPALLLRSGIGPAEELRAQGVPVVRDLPSVGRNLHDHLLSGGNVYRARRQVPPSHYQHSESLMYVNRADVGTGAPELVLACVVLPVTTERFQAPPPGEAYTLMFGFTHPRSRGTVRLCNADARIAPMIDPNYLAEEYDRAIYLEALELARKVGAAKALADWRAEEILPGPTISTLAQKRAFLAQAAFTHHHPVGTCRMGADEASVVDARLKVRGIEGLYVCDASIMPEITTGPVNAAIIAIAERASDLLRARKPLKPIDPAMLAGG